jgi:hypothetical protein
MKLAQLAQVVVVNALLIPLLALITENYALRAAYWGHENFTYNMVRYPFLFITSATNGSTHIPGLLSIDWQQVVLVVLVLADGWFVWSALKSRRRDSGTAPQSP